jgi:hypothetical protein
VSERKRKKGLEGSTFNSKECENYGLMTFSIIINKLKLLYEEFRARKVQRTKSENGNFEWEERLNNVMG